MSFKIFLKKLKHKVDIYLCKPFLYRKGKRVLAKIIAEKGNNEVIFVNRNPIGDIDTIELFSSDSEILKKLLVISGFPRLCAQGAKRGVYMTLPIAKRKGNLDAIRQQRLTVFHLDENAPITYHGLTKGKVNSIDNLDIIKDKVVIINPYSTTMRYVTMTLYEKLCDILISHGYKVYTNIVGDQKPVEGSEPLQCSIEELYSIACNIPLIVSVRSGILDLLVNTNINMFVLYENVTKSRCYDFYRLNAWHCQGVVEEIYISNKKILEQVPDRFSAYLEQLEL